jgi:hypothetical protein
MSSTSARIYNIISALFFILTIGFIGVVAYLFITIDPEARKPQIVLPTQVTIPTETPTNTHTATSTFTHTPTATTTNTLAPTQTLTPTHTLTPSPTLTATVTASPTITATPTITMTPTETPTATPTPTPTGPSATPTPTDSPFLFAVPTGIDFRPNTTNMAGCAWQSIAGTVIGIDGQPVTTPFNIRVWNNSSFNQYVQTGTNSFYEPIAGWEVQVSNIVNMETYYVRLETTTGVVLSENIQIDFPQDCGSNVAFIRFVQTRSG